MNAKSVIAKIATLLSLEDKSLELVEAKTRDGAILQSPTFDLGEKVEVVSEDGTKTPAPDGEHEIALRDSEGNEVLIKIETKDGIITERENVELPSEEAKSVEEEMEKKMDEEVVDKKAYEEKMADVTTEEAKSLPNTTSESDANEIPKPSQEDEPIMKLSYRIEELEKKMKMMEDKFTSAYPSEGQEVSSLLPSDVKMSEVDPKDDEEEEELPKLDGAPVEVENKINLSSKYNSKANKVGNYQDSFLSKLYK
jgi:hypothetical protein